jgi:uncharacterized protein (TIGR02145 family)
MWRELTIPGFSYFHNDWEELINFLGGWGVASEKLKSTTDWERESIGGTNKSNYPGLPAGINGGQYYIGQFGYWWAVTGRPDYVCYYILSSDSYSGNIIRRYENITNSPYASAYSVRCVKDSI